MILWQLKCWGDNTWNALGVQRGSMADASNAESPIIFKPGSNTEQSNVSMVSTGGLPYTCATSEENEVPKKKMASDR